MSTIWVSGRLHSWPLSLIHIFVKAHSNPAGIVRWRSDWARLNDWRINNELFNYYVEYAEEAVPWVISQGRSVGIEPIEFLTDSSIRYDDGGVVAVCDATQASNQDLMAVSYTHLDVYKRQPMNCSARGPSAKAGRRESAPMSTMMTNSSTANKAPEVESPTAPVA